MRQFGDINEIREATVAQLADVEGMNERAAESVYEFFQFSGLQNGHKLIQ